LGVFVVDASEMASKLGKPKEAWERFW
jgi:hypothetical protein